MAEDKYYSKYFVYKTSNNNLGNDGSNRRKSEELMKGLQQAVRERRAPKFCKTCAIKLEYKGLGQYVCENCGESVYTNYGKIRKVMDIGQGMTVTEICEQTGLTKEDINELIEDGSVQVIGGSITLLK